MKRWLLSPVVALALALAAAVQAAPPVEADPNKDYPIDTQAGSYVVVAATYKGEDAANLARQLVYHLRKVHNLPAYSNYNHADRKRAQLEEERKRWKAQYPEAPFRHEQIDEDQYSVLIGGFDSFVSASDFIKYQLKNDKLFPLPLLKLDNGHDPYDRAYINVQEHGITVLKKLPISPYASSFASRNPALGAAAKVVDPLVIKMNAEEDYSLFKCPAPWTMAVQSYGGSATYVPITQKEPQQPSMAGGFLDTLWGGDKATGQALIGAAAQAHETAGVLRKLGFDAYVLHTRHYSIVTVGGFNGPADPAMIHTADRLAELKLIDRLHLLKNPTSCEVPRP